jgi:flagellar M-ring protein FliF
LNGVLEALRKFGIGRLAMIGGVAAGVIAVLAAIMLRAGNEPKSLLYADLDLKEARPSPRRWTPAGPSTS